MKTKLLLIPLLALSSLEAEEAIEPQTIKQEHGYASFGLGPAPIPLPIFSLGYRMQNGHHGADVSLQAATIVSYTALKANAYYLHYFKPSYASEFYVGGGATLGGIFGNDSGLFTGPEFVFGKQYRNESNDLRFFQMQVTLPTISWHRHHHAEVLKYPLVVFSYGLGF